MFLNNLNYSPSVRFLSPNTGYTGYVLVQTYFPIKIVAFSGCRSNKARCDRMGRDHQGNCRVGVASRGGESEERASHEDR